MNDRKSTQTLDISTPSAVNASRADKKILAMPWLDAFLDMLVTQQNLSPHTVQAYRRDMRTWYTFMAHVGLQEWREVVFAHHGAYVDWLRGKGLSDRSVARHLASWRHFVHFLLGERILADDPWQGCRSPSYACKLPHVLTTQDMQVLLAYGQRGESPEALRVGVLLEMLYATGMRVSELISLPVFRLQPGEVPSFCIRGKGGRERFVFVTPTAQIALERYVPVRLHFSPTRSSGYLFPSYSQQGYLTRQRVGQVLKEAAVACGIDPHTVCPHGIRHAFATHLLHRGVDLVTLKQLLGHQDIATTQLYTHVQTQQWAMLLAKHHPLASGDKGHAAH